jgi:hypothetical protein
MAIKNLSKNEFGTQLNTFISPAQPITSVEHLFGREAELSRIEKALYAHGRHIFIYGVRGVGKSSLAATAANQYQSAEAEYIDVSCSPDATLASVVVSIALQAYRTSKVKFENTKTNVSVGPKFLNFAKTSETGIRNLAGEIRTITDAVEVLKEVAEHHSERPIVVVDEFDRLNDDFQKDLFADLLKHLGDKRIPIKFIFTGVGTSLDEILGAHRSAIRQLETIELPKLSWDARWDIALHAARAFDLELSRNIYVRMAAVSDGFPYYVHLLIDKMMWYAFEEEEPVKELTWEHYQLGLREAIESISAELKRPYRMAINQRSGDYEEVLWSTADSEWLERYLKDMYSSYEYIMNQIPNRKALSYDKYASRIRNLKRPSFGEILVSEDRPGLYSYKEKMLRGFVRMQAEAHGIELIGEGVSKEVKQVMHAPARASSGVYGPSVPRGVHFGRKRRS